MTKTEPRSAGSGGGRDKTTPAKLLACPFCGGPATVYRGRLLDNYYPTCLRDDRCPGINWDQDEQGGTACDSNTESEAIAAWNTRAASTLSAREDGWLPIETAPKDGTRIIVDFGSRVGIVTCAWEESVSGSEIWCVDDFKFGPYAIRGYVDEDIIGWQPLPAPKAPTAGEGHER